MSNFYLPPPTDKAGVQRALNYHYDASSQEHGHKAQFWTFTHWYLQGMRSLRLRGLPGSAMPSLNYIDPQGRRRVRWEKALVQVQVEQARILGMDISPAVRRRPGLSLSNIRDDAVSLALLEHVARHKLTRNMRVDIAFNLVAYGMVGVVVTDPWPDLGGWMPDIQLVPAWELRPLPSGITGSTQRGGITWATWVPLPWLKERLKGLKRVKPSEDTTVLTAPAGAKIHQAESPASLFGNINGVGALSTISASSLDKNRDKQDAPDEHDIEYVELRQHWITNEDYTTSRFIMQLGRGEPIIDEDYTSEEWQQKLNGELPICPLSVLGYQSVGSFWPRGFADRQIPVARELEFLLGDFIENLRQMDRLRFLAIPLSAGINERNFVEHLRNRLLPYQPDYATQGRNKPEIMSPPNTGDAFGKSINALGAMLNDTAAQGELMYGGIPGRAESGTGLAIVAEQQNTPMAVVGELLEHGMVGVYKGIQSYVRCAQKYKGREIVIELGRMDEMSVGLQLNVADGGVTVTPDAIPSPLGIDHTIRTKVPRSKQAIQAYLKEQKASGQITAVDFDILAIKEGLDVPVADMTPFNNHEVANLENSILYGDGKTPGKLSGSWSKNSFADNHVIHYMQHLKVIQSIAFRAASDAVQTALVEHLMYHSKFLGKNTPMPDDIMTVDDSGRGAPVNPGLQQAIGQPPAMGMGTGDGTL